MPTLEWIGKDKVVNHYLYVPYRALECKYSFDENGQTDAGNESWAYNDAAAKKGRGILCVRRQQR